LIGTHLRNAWHHGLVGRVAHRFVRESRVCGAAVRGVSAAARAGVAIFNRSERAIGRAGQPDPRVLTLPPLADLSPALTGGTAVKMVVDVMSGWRRAWDESRCARLLAREQAAFAGAPRSTVVLAIGVAWLTATAVHALLSTLDYEPASWMAWAVSTGIGLALVSGRTPIADAWTAAAERREVAVPDTALTRVRMQVVTPFPEEGAGYRFRISQYIPALRQAGFDVSVSPFFTREFFGIVYRPGHYLRKLAFLVAQMPKRLALLRARGAYDLIFIYREAFPVGPPLIELMLARPGGPAIVYDFDDAVFLGDTSEANRVIGFLKYPAKTRAIVAASHGVIAGNTYLANYALAFNDAVTVMPTCVDTDVFVPRAASRAADDPLVVGWIGSPTTVRYLLEYGDVLAELARRCPFVLRVAGAGRPIEVPGVAIENVEWSLDREVALFNTCDVGIYPLADDLWTRGKCGFKAIQFMACGVPVVASAVGVNCEIVDDGVNGFLARTREEWVDKLARLCGDPGLRERLGRAGRQRVDDRYSLRRNTPLMIEALDQALARTGRVRAGVTR
jgi:glycosyltransferase involved in cell wall biosynthesis